MKRLLILLFLFATAAGAQNITGVNTPTGSGHGSLVNNNVPVANGPASLTDSRVNAGALPRPPYPIIITSSQPINLAYCCYRFDATSGPITLTLPLSSTAPTPGVAEQIQKVDSSPNAGIVALTSPDTLNGSSSTTPILGQWDVVTIYTGGSSWFVQ